MKQPAISSRKQRLTALPEPKAITRNYRYHQLLPKDCQRHHGTPAMDPEA